MEIKFTLKDGQGNEMKPPSSSRREPRSERPAPREHDRRERSTTDRDAHAREGRWPRGQEVVESDADRKRRVCRNLHFSK